MIKKRGGIFSDAFCDKRIEYLNDNYISSILQPISRRLLFSFILLVTNFLELAVHPGVCKDQQKKMAQNLNGGLFNVWYNVKNEDDHRLQDEEAREQDLRRRNEAGGMGASNITKISYEGPGTSGTQNDDDIYGDVHGKFRTPRIFWQGSLDSQGCPRVACAEVKRIFRYIIMNLGAYGNDKKGLTKDINEHDPSFEPNGVVDFQRPSMPGACPPYFIYVDKERQEVSMYIRGLNLMHREDYKVLLNNRRGEKPFDGGYVHFGMSEAAEWAVEKVAPDLKKLLMANPGYRLTIVGHSLGAGVASLLTLFLICDTKKLGGISSDLISCIAIAPPRVMSLDLALKYSLPITSVIYQDDFLPRVSTQAVKKFICKLSIFKPDAALLVYLSKQLLQMSKTTDDTQRLFPPGKIYHCVYKKPGKSEDRPIRARVVHPEKHKFERIVLSQSSIQNHYILELTKHLKKYNWPEEVKDKWLKSVLTTA